uniref:Calcium/calmodulin-dependent protein kinase II-like n=1 Tax=Phallusia mammillata TaxID=59560 RepID=A0A6F9D7J0_9ASCI|nr:calcium/calmodulin-dependent protein kinase II-like [Phallusia mammillata]
MQDRKLVKKLEEYSAGHISCDALNSVIGQGGFGTVLLGKHSRVGHVAIKCFNVAGGEHEQVMVEQTIRHEYDMLIQSSHENIVYVYGFTKWTASMGIVMQYYEGGNMSSLLLNPTIKIGRSLSLRLATEIATGVAFIHNCGSQKRMLHGDLKPENILLTADLHCKIGDFGCAKTANYTGSATPTQEVPEKQFLTMYYAAPEKLLHNAAPKKEQDTYSCGFIYHMILFSVVPYSISYHLQDFLPLLANGMRPNCDAIQDLKDSCSTNDKAIVEKLEKVMRECWEQDAVDRPDMLNVRDELQQHLATQDPVVISQQVTDAVSNMRIRHPSNIYTPTVPLHQFSTRTWKFPYPQNEVTADPSNITQPESTVMQTDEDQLNATQPKCINADAPITEASASESNLTKSQSIEIQAPIVEASGSSLNLTQSSSVEIMASITEASTTQLNLTQPKSVEIKGPVTEASPSELNLTQGRSIELLAPPNEENNSRLNLTQPIQEETAVESHVPQLNRSRKARTVDRGKTVRRRKPGGKHAASVSEYRETTDNRHKVLQPTISAPLLGSQQRGESMSTPMKIVQAFSQSSKSTGSTKRNFLHSFVHNWRTKLSVPRLSETPGFLVIGGEGSLRDFVRFDISTNLCRPLQVLPSERCCAASVKVGVKVYTVGGAPDVWHNYHKSGEMIDMTDQQGWITLPDMTEARGYHAAAVVADHIYVTGGYNGTSLSSCEKFSIHNQKWTRIKDMINARDEHGTVAHNGLLYCIGGSNGCRLSPCECLDVKLEKWTEIAPLNEPRHSLACVVLDGFIYAIGGCGDNGHLSSVERYCPKANKWETVASLCVARSRPCACVVQDKIFVIGGYNGGMLKSVEVYDQTENHWAVSFETDKPYGGSTVVAV